MAKTEIRADVTLDTTRFQRSLARAQRSVRNFAKSGAASIVRFGAAFAGIGLLNRIKNLGVSAAETASKFKAVFGPAADSMNLKIKELRETIPSTTTEMQNALSTFAAMAKGFGLNTEAANLFSVEMVKMSGDIASFHNMPIEDAFMKIRSAISGEFEPLKSLGIVINEARLKQEGLNLAIWDGSGQMSAAQKALAVQSIMIRDLGAANGDAAATADSAANKLKKLNKRLIEIGTNIGVTILPGVVELTEAFGRLIEMTTGAMAGVGTSLGELVYGNADRIQAERNLEFRGTPKGRGRGGAERYKQQIEDEIALIKKKRKEEEKAAKEKLREQEKSIKNAADLGAELENQIDAETDPIRKQALTDRLNAYKALIEAAGELESLQGGKPGSSAAEKQKEKMMAGGDLNADGITTGREMRAKERADRAAASAKRRAYTSAVVKGNLEASARTIKPSEVKPRTTELSMAQSLKAIEREMTKTAT